MKTITVFGSALVRPGDDDYEASKQVGWLLAKAGYTVMTGGYAGVMEAASWGAAEAGGHVIGVTCTQIENLSGSKANKWVREEVKLGPIRDRLLYMIENAAGYVAMPGGVGTLHEIAETWELMRLEGVPKRPLICYGGYWENIIGQLKASRYVADSYHQLVHFAHAPEAVVSILHSSNGAVLPNDFAG